MFSHVLDTPWKITNRIFSLIVRPYIRLLFFKNGKPVDQLPDKTLTKEGLELKWQMQDIPSRGKLDIMYDLRRRVSRTIVFIHEGHCRFSMSEVIPAQADSIKRKKQTPEITSPLQSSGLQPASADISINEQLCHRLLLRSFKDFRQAEIETFLADAMLVYQGFLDA